MILLYLTSGLFLGWSLGANDAANVFGSAVGTRMVRFRNAALIAGIFVVTGAVLQGSGTTGTLSELGSVNALGGSFVAALAAGITVFIMTRFTIPVSTSQAIVGAIIGWNLYTGSATNLDTLREIVITWVLCPVLAAVFSILLYLLFRWITNRVRIHLLRLSLIIKISLLLVGAFGAYSLGANNIANVMGVYVDAISIPAINLGKLGVITGQQQLFFIGGVAIATGIFTYSKRIMQRVGGKLIRLNMESTIVVVLAHSLVLFIFSSQALHDFLVRNGLPGTPLVPVSSSQAIIGAIFGIGILKGASEIKFSAFGQIGLGWVISPVIACILTFFSLFFMENVFRQEVYQQKSIEQSMEVPAEGLKNEENSLIWK
jgi:PiT family inorganic phosphate transporter